MNILGPACRVLGQRLHQTGLTFHSAYANDRLVPSLRSVAFENKTPQIEKADFIAPNAVILGDVVIGENSSLWYGTTLRGDISKISIGRNTILQDLVTVAAKSKETVSIGENVFVGPNAILNSCKLENEAFVGMGATVNEKVEVSGGAVVAAGAVVQKGSKVGKGQLWAGNPAAHLRDLTSEEIDVLKEHRVEIAQLAKIHAEENQKSLRQVLTDQDTREEEDLYDAEELALKHIKELGFPTEFEDEEHTEQRLINQLIVFRVYCRDRPLHTGEPWKKNYDPYEQDLYNYPDKNYEKYEEIKKRFEDQDEIVDAKPLERKEWVPPQHQANWTEKF